MKIGELAHRGACSVETVRFYEREGLLDAPEREANGYRRYTRTHLAQLNFIRHCRSLGMGLSDVRTLRSLQAHPELACDDISLLIERQIERVHQQIQALNLLEGQLHALREACHAATNVGECGILRNLEQAIEGKGCTCHAPGRENGR